MKPAVGFALSILFAVAGCTREARDTPAAAVPPPAALLVDVGLPSLDGGLAGVRQFVETVQPGAGILVSERQFLTMAGIGGLDGAAGDKPAHVLLVDPDKHPRPLAVLVGVADAAKLKASVKTAGLELRTQGGHALVGDKDVLALLGDWALGTLSRAKAPPVPVATVYSATVLALYRGDIEKAGAKMKEQMAALPTSTPALLSIVDYYVKGALALLEGSDRLEVRVEADASDLGLVLGLVGKKDSKIAAFIAAQAPSDFALLERLPPGHAPIVMAGKLLLGPLRADALALVEKLMTEADVAVTPDLKALMTTWADSMTGDVAATIEMAPGRIHMAQLVGVDDPRKVHAALGSALAAWAGKPIAATALGITTKYTVTPDAATIDGVPFHRYVSAVDTSKMTPEQAKLATPLGNEFVCLVGAWDHVMGVSYGGAEADAKALVDASRGKGERLALSPRMASDVAAARARKESVYYFIDMGAMMASMAPATGIQLPGPFGFAMTAGFAGGTAQLRFALKAAEIKAIVTAARGAAAAQ